MVWRKNYTLEDFFRVWAEGGDVFSYEGEGPTEPRKQVRVESRKVVNPFTGKAMEIKGRAIPEDAE